jgi:hypothetical protein
MAGARRRLPGLPDSLAPRIAQEGICHACLRECRSDRCSARGPLPPIGIVRRWSQSLALLDAILSAEPEYRYFSFDSESGQALASMSNGCGDEYSISFTGEGAFLRGFDHESPLSRPFTQAPPALCPGILTGLPAALASVAHQSAFTLAGVPRMTVALWRLAGEEQWGHGQITYPQAWDPQYQDLDGSSWLFAQLDGRAGNYLDYASEYFERQLPPRR